jgi:hypothetical protein
VSGSGIDAENTSVARIGDALVAAAESSAPKAKAPRQRTKATDLDVQQVCTALSLLILHLTEHCEG